MAGVTSCFSTGYSAYHKVYKTEFIVSKTTTVRPAGKILTPVGPYKVSNLDQTIPYPIEVIFVFQTQNYNVNVGQVMKESLEKVLDKYYPLAGRLKIGCDGKMVVECGGDGGVPFAEAFADAEAAAVVGDISGIDEKLVRKLVCSKHKPCETILDVPPLTVQMTRFKCGGIILGMGFNHVFFDGISFLDFMTSWSEIARGLPLSIDPCLDRSILYARRSPKIEFSHPEYSRIERPLATPLTGGDTTTVTKSFRLSPEAISRLRNSGDDECMAVEPAPTMFEIITALSWISWTKAKKLSSDENTQLAMAVDGRSKLRPPLEKGYFGNCIVWACAKTTVQELTSRPLLHAVGILRSAKTAITEDFIRSAIDFHEITGRPLELDNTMWSTKWTRLSFYEIDFGWGTAAKMGPGPAWENLLVIFAEEKKSKNVAFSLSLPAEVMEIFQEIVQSNYY